MELWDLYDKNRKPLNKVHQRGLPMADDEFHIVVSIITVNSKKQILVTHRDPNKEMYPNLWEVTAGSVISGEESRTAALRELFEETGIKINDNELIALKTLKGDTKGRRSFVDVYLVRKDVEIKNLTMQKGETTEAKWVTFSEFEKMAQAGVIAKSAVKRFNTIKPLLLKKL